MLAGRLGLETARIPYVDRYGLMWLERGKLYVEDGVLTFATAGVKDLKKGVYQIPFQTVSFILLGPGTTVSHDALRLLARHGTGLVAVGEDGVRCYASMPFGPDWSELARKQVELWADKERRLDVARRMYAFRLGELLVRDDLEVLRGIEGTRMKEVYRRLAKQYGVEWRGRRYDRARPEKDDAINTAINHASTAINAAAMIAVAATATVPQLGFIHETSSRAFALDIGDMYRATLALPVAFEAAKTCEREGQDVERVTRQLAGDRLRREKTIPDMIETIKKVLDVDDDSPHA